MFLAACGGGGNSGATPQTGANGAADTGGSATGGTGGAAQPTTPSPSTQGAAPAPSTTGTPGENTSGSNTPVNTNGGTSGGTTNGNDTPAPPDATQARFNQPIGIAIDRDGNLYVADSMNYTIRKIAASGAVNTLAGTPGASGSTDGIGAAARFSFLKGVAVDGAGVVYAVDGNAIRKITPAGTVTTLAGAIGETGNADGPGSVARFAQPWGIAVDATGKLYVADTGNSLVRAVSTAGVVSTHAGTRGMRGTANGSTATATFLGPMGVALDAGNNLYLTDWYGPPAPNIPEGSTFIRRIGADGTVSTLAGNFGGETGPAAFMDTFAIAADASGNVYVAAMRSIRRVSSTGTVSTLAGPSEQFQVLQGILIDGAGNLFVTDASNHTVSRVGQNGAITPVAGMTGEAGSRDAP